MSAAPRCALRCLGAVGTAVLLVAATPVVSRAQDVPPQDVSPQAAPLQQGRAQGGAPVHVEASACSAAAMGEVAPLLQVELGARLLQAPAPGALRVVIECAGDEVLISALAAGAAPRRQRLSLATVPYALRARIVALQVAEMARGEPPPAPVSTARATPAPIEVASEPAAAAAPERMRLQLFGQASAFHRDGRWLWGGGLRLEHPLGAWLAGIDAAIATRSDASELGEARVLSAYLAPHVALPARAGRVAARVGAGVAGGLARIDGDSSDPAATAATVTGAWAAPYALAGVGFALTSRLRLDARAEAGWVLFPVIGEVARARNVAIDGVWINLQLGASLAF